MKNAILFFFILISAVLFYSCNNSGSGPTIEGSWDCGDDCSWSCTITKQDGGIIMRIKDGEKIAETVFKKKSNEFYEFYHAESGTLITLIYHDDPPRGENDCPGRHKGHWRLSSDGGKEGKVITLSGKGEKC